MTKKQLYKRPREGTKSARVWELADELRDRDAVMKAGLDEGLNVGTIGGQYVRWARNNGVALPKRRVTKGKSPFVHTLEVLAQAKAAKVPVSQTLLNWVTAQAEAEKTTAKNGTAAKGKAAPASKPKRKARKPAAKAKAASKPKPKTKAKVKKATAKKPAANAKTTAKAKAAAKDADTGDASG